VSRSDHLVQHLSPRQPADQVALLRAEIMQLGRPREVMGDLRETPSCSCTPPPTLAREIEHAGDLDHQRRGKN
jgi:hypothetical protein